ncbi:MAG: OmpA family protein [Pseudomonadota bacterium]
MRLTGRPPTRRVAFEAAFAALAAALPAGVALDALWEGAPTAQTTAQTTETTRPLWLTVELSAEGARLAGRAPSAVEASALRRAAAARFGTARVDARALTGLAPDEVASADDPAGFQTAALAAIRGLGQVATGGHGRSPSGQAALVPGRLSLAAVLSSAAAARDLQVTLEAAVPADLTLETRLTIDLPRAVAGLELPERACAAALNRIVAFQPISFSPGSASLDATAEPVLDRLARLLGRCEGVAIEIGGHTDNQGRATTNARLSRARADSVRQALRRRGVPVSAVALNARGYGESEPVADNTTPEGRALNRRITFRAASAARTAATATDGAGAQGAVEAEEGSD